MIYRMHEKGLEIFLIKPQLDQDPEIWKLPQGIRDRSKDEDSFDVINLESISDEKGERYNFIALEGDWHDIPSIRGIIKHDIKRAKRKIKELLPDLSNGSFIAVSEIMDKLYPHEQKAVVELQEIISHRNMLRHL